MPVRVSLASAALLLAALMPLAACSPERRAMRLNEVEMARSEVSELELDRLNSFVGSWQGYAEQRDVETDRVTRFEGSSTVNWELGRRFLLERSEFTRNGSPETSLSITTWDPKARAYRIWKFESTGAVLEGESWFPTDNPLVWRTHRITREAITEGTLTLAADSSQMDTVYEVRSRSSGDIIARGVASARRVQ
ncbi:MAG: DUF1579 family protein [Planctomycetota bacterium]|nr:DUF1579 family protein [Planctomycetota bacterium]